MEKITINTKVKYRNAANYQKHFTLDDRVTIQKIIAEHRNPKGSFNFNLKDIGSILTNDPSTILKK